MGSALVIADANFSAYAKGKVNILKPVPVTGMAINGESSGKIGDIIHLSVTFTPSNTIFRAVAWSVDDPTKASISENGDLLLLEDGDVVVTASSVGFRVEATKEISIITSGEVLEVKTKVKCVGGYIQYNTGNAVNSSELCHPTLLDISPFSKFETELFNSSSTSSVAGYAFYDTDKKFMSGARGTAGDGQNDPISVITTNLAAGTTFFCSTIKGVTGDMVNFSGVLKTSLGLSLVIDCLEGLKANYMISGLTGAESKVTSAFVAASDYVAIPSGKTKCLIPLFEDKSDALHVGYAFYDSAKGFISGNYITAASATAKFEEIEIPSNAQFVRATFHQYGFSFIMF